jgi:hypothetical protein
MPGEPADPDNGDFCCFTYWYVCSDDGCTCSATPP